MSEIPDDIKIAAQNALADGPEHMLPDYGVNEEALVDAIGRSILFERQRQAEVMEEVKKEGRRQGLEEGAAWHEGEAEKFGELYHANKHNLVLSDKLAGDVIKHQAYASSIRALLSRLEGR